MHNIIESETWKEILTSYTNFFQYTRKLGVFPYNFNAETLEVTVLHSGFSYYFFIFNAIFFIIHTFKSGLLAVLHVSTNFESEEMQDGLIFNLLWLISQLQAWTMLISYVWDKQRFASILTSCIRFEKEFVTGMRCTYKVHTCAVIMKDILRYNILAAIRYGCTLSWSAVRMKLFRMINSHEEKI